MSKQLIVLCDGTDESPQTDIAGTPDNVQLMRQILAENTPGTNNVATNYKQGWQVDSSIYNGTQRYVYYDAGLGTPQLNSQGQVVNWQFKASTPFKDAAAIYKNFLDLDADIFASGIVDNVAQAYTFLVNYYNPGDQIYLFGFSRGAYTLRLLISVINYIGLIDRNKYATAAELTAAIEKGFGLYRYNVPPNAPNSPANAFRIQNSVPLDNLIHFLGAWDCVPGMVAEKIYEQAELSAIVTTARHALAIDEMRPPYVPQVWQATSGTDSQQIWVPGSHMDVGGGNPDHNLANEALQWMVGEAIQAGLSVNPSNLSAASLAGDPLGVQHDSSAADIATGIPVTWQDLFKPTWRTITLGNDVSLSPTTLQRYQQVVTTIEGTAEVKGPYQPENLTPGVLLAYNSQLAKGGSITAAAVQPAASALEQERGDIRSPTVVPL